MAVTLSPIFNGFQGFLAGGLPNSGGLINTYLAGTSTPSPTYTSNTGGIANTNPIQLDSAGRPPAEVWLTAGVAYKFVYTDSLGLSPITYDNIQGIGGGDVLSSDLANTSNVAKGAALVGNKYNAATAVGLNLHDYIEDDGSYNVMGFIAQNLKPAIRDRTSVADVSTQIMTAMAAISSERGGGQLKIPAGKFNVGSPIIGVNGVGIEGEGSAATLITVTGTNNGIQYGDGVTQFVGTVISGFSIIGTTTSGIGLWGRIFTDSCMIRDVFVKGGTTGIKLDSCYSLGLENVRVRSALLNGIECNAITHNTNLFRVKVQVCGQHGMQTTGCYTLVVRDSNFEFNAFDQINVQSGRGLTFADVYIEGMASRASGYAGIQVVAADIINVEGGLYDATQVVASPVDDFGRALPPRDGTGTYVKVGGVSTRVRFRDYGFVSLANTQTHVNFGASTTNCEATVPLGATYVNSSPAGRVYSDDYDERGVTVYNTASQTYTFGVWNGLTIDTVQMDPKSEWTSNQFTPKDYGTYDWDVAVGVTALAAGKDFQVRLYNITDGFQICQPVSFTNTGGVAITTVWPAHFKELLSPLKTYQIQLFLNDTANRNSVAGASTARQTIKRIR